MLEVGEDRGRGGGNGTPTLSRSKMSVCVCVCVYKTWPQLSQADPPLENDKEPCYSPTLGET